MAASFDELDKLNIRVRALRVAASPILVEAPVEILGNAYACSVGRYSCLNSMIGGLHGTVRIGRYCLAAAGSQIGVGGHPTDWLSIHFFQYRDYFEPAGVLKDGFRETEDTFVGNDVWIGTNAIIRSGVTIGDGAIIGAGAVVLSDVAPFAVVAGVPARQIRSRFADPLVERLLALRWWEFDHAAIADLPFNDVPRCLDLLEDRIARLKLDRRPVEYLKLV